MRRPLTQAIGFCLSIALVWLITVLNSEVRVLILLYNAFTPGTLPSAWSEDMSIILSIKTSYVYVVSFLNV